MNVFHWFMGQLWWVTLSRAPWRIFLFFERILNKSLVRNSQNKFQFYLYFKGITLSIVPPTECLETAQSLANMLRFLIKWRRRCALVSQSGGVRGSGGQRMFFFFGNRRRRGRWKFIDFSRIRRSGKQAWFCLEWCKFLCSFVAFVIGALERFQSSFHISESVLERRI